MKPDRGPEVATNLALRKFGTDFQSVTVFRVAESAVKELNDCRFPGPGWYWVYGERGDPAGDATGPWKTESDAFHHVAASIKLSEEIARKEGN